MKAIDPFDQEPAPGYEAPPPLPNLTYTAERILVGHCPSPDCRPFGGQPLAVFNDRGTWPLVACPCGWRGQTTELVNIRRLDQGWRVSDETGVERELRP